MFASNVFKKATKDVKYSFENKTGNGGVTDVRGYSKAVIQFSATPNVSISGYIDSDRNSPVVSNLAKTDLNGKLIFDNIKTQGPVIVDVSNLSNIYLGFAESYTGDVYVHLCSDKADINTNGVTQIGTHYIEVASGTNSYDTGELPYDVSHFRFIAFEVKRRDGAGNLPFTATVKEYHQINKEQGAGSRWSEGRIVIDVTDASNGYAESEWIENFSPNHISATIAIDGETYDGALIELNIIGIV